MIQCQHFIYTTASLKDKSGYQIVAQSNRILPELFTKLQGNFLPVGADPTNFDKCYMFFVFRDDVVFSTIKNIGVGFDGRNNTLYNHSIVIKKTNFLKIHNNPKILSKFFIEDYSLKGDLVPIEIPDDNFEQEELSYFRNLPKTVLENIFDAVFSGKKIALYGIKKDDFLINLISLLPESLRLQSFATKITDPNNQYPFNFLQMDSNIKLKKNEDYKIINVSTLDPIYTHDADIVFERSIKFFTELIKNGQTESLQSLNTFFDEISNVSNFEKLKVTAYFERIKNISDQTSKQRYSIDLLNMLENYDLGVIGKILPTIKNFVPLEIYNNYSIQLEILHIVKSTSDTPIDFEYVSSLFHRLSYDTSENRLLILDELIKTRFDEIKNIGDKLLLDSRYSLYYEKDIIRKFLETPTLHSCIFQLFVPREDFPNVYQRAFFEVIIEESLNTNLLFTLKLLQTTVFDFTDSSESKHYRKILERVFENSAINDNIYLSDIFNLSQFIFTKITQIINQKNLSGTSGTTKSSIKQFVKITKILLEYFNTQIQTKESFTKQESILKHINILKQFINEYHDASEPEKKYWWQWWQ